MNMTDITYTDILYIYIYTYIIVTTLRHIFTHVCLILRVNVEKIFHTISASGEKKRLSGVLVLSHQSDF